MSRFNYIKSHRRKWKLTQKELAYLFDYEGSSHFSRIESGKAAPTLEDAIIGELLFEKAASRLFPDIYHEVSTKLIARLSQFEELLTEVPQSEANAQKLSAVRKVKDGIAVINDQRI